MENESPVISAVEEKVPETDLVQLLMQMQRQLTELERKIDVLVRQSQERRSGSRSSADRPFQRREFSKAPRSFDRPRRHGGTEREHASRDSENRETARKRFYDRFKSGSRQGAKPGKKKPFRGTAD